MTFKVLDKCLVCDSENLTTYFKSSPTPLANNYSNKAGDSVNVYPLEVNYCSDCSHSQLSVAVDPKEMYDNYLYVPGVSPTMVKHFQSYAKDLYSYLEHKEEPKVLDIGSNDGTLLQAFKDLGVKDVQGVDPASNLQSDLEARGIKTHVGYWSHEYSTSLVSEVGQFDLITGNNVFAHQQNPSDFLQGVLHALKPEGILSIEVPYHLSSVSGNQWDHIYHEHINYFTVNSFRTLLRRHGFTIIGYKPVGTHGGSMRVLARKVGTRSCEPKLFLDHFYHPEMNQKLRNGKKFNEFSRLVKGIWSALSLAVNVNSGKVVFYGASAGTTTTLYNILRANVSYIVDDSKLKQGKFIPGTSIEIKPPEALAQETEPLTIFLSAHKYKDDIIKKLRGLGVRGEVITYIPDFSVETL